MIGIVSKVRTVCNYAALGTRLGRDLRSKWLLASMLPRHLLRSAFRLDGINIYTAMIRFGAMQTQLHFREQDIFIVQEMFGSDGYITAVLRRDPPQHILDLGTHIGLATLRFKASFPEARIDCYEPDPDNFRLLTLNTKGLEGITLHHQAVGAASGETLFYVYPSRHSSSSLKRQTQENVAAVQVHCIVKTLDAILAETGPVDLIKFDIEGAEYEVFSHSRTVHEVQYLVGEMRAERAELDQFVSLFPEYQAHWHNLTPHTYYVYLHRKESEA